LVRKRTLDIPKPRKRTFWISEETDVALKVRAATDNVRFSDVAEIAFRKYLELDKDKKKKGVT
jgi:hypothetical protein